MNSVRLLPSDTLIAPGGDVLGNVTRCMGSGQIGFAMLELPVVHSSLALFVPAAAMWADADVATAVARPMRCNCCLLFVKGFLAPAMVNYLSLLGWNDGSEQEIYAVEVLQQKFALERITKSAAVFDKVKLAWMNGQHLRYELQL